MNALEIGLTSKLTGDATLTTLLGGAYVYNGIAPRGKDLPYIIFTQQSGTELNRTPRRETEFLYLVKALSPSLATAGTIADRIDAVLHDTTLTVTGWTNFWCRRATTVRYIETTEQGGIIGHAGAIYTISLSE